MVNWIGQRHRIQRWGRRQADVLALQSEHVSGMRHGGHQRERDDGYIRGRGATARRQVNAQHRQTEESRLEQGLVIYAPHLRRGREIGLFGPNQRFADGHRARARAEFFAEFLIQQLAVRNEVGVAVTIPRVEDRRYLFPGECLRPVRSLGDIRNRVPINNVVAGVTTRAEENGIFQVHRRCQQLGGQQVRGVVSRQQADGAEVTGQENQVVSSTQQQRPELVRGPAQFRRLVAVGNEGVHCSANTDAQLQFVGDRPRNVLQEVIAGDQSRLGSWHHPARCGRISVQHSGNFARRLNHAANGQVRNGECAGLEGQIALRPIRVLAEHITEPQAGL